MNQSSLALTTQPAWSNESSFGSAAMGKNTFMRYAQVIYVAVLVVLGVCGNILCAIVFLTKSLR